MPAPSTLARREPGRSSSGPVLPGRGRRGSPRPPRSPARAREPPGRGPAPRSQWQRNGRRHRSRSRGSRTRAADRGPARRGRGGPRGGGTRPTRRRASRRPCATRRARARRSGRAARPRPGAHARWPRRTTPRAWAARRQAVAASGGSSEAGRRPTLRPFPDATRSPATRPGAPGDGHRRRAEREPTFPARTTLSTWFRATAPRCRATRGSARVLGHPATITSRTDTKPRQKLLGERRDRVGSVCSS
jgi:hypothetical protein